MNKLTERDLMVGDWFNFLIDIEGGDTEYDPKNEVYQPMQVRDITSFGVNDGEVSSYEGVVNDIAQLQPIPLTAQILEKNGFEYKEADETCATEAFHLWLLDGSRFAIDDDSWWRSVKDGELHVKFGGFPLKYLHQLQHALRLAGIDKEIKL